MTSQLPPSYHSGCSFPLNGVTAGIGEGAGAEVGGCWGLRDAGGAAMPVLRWGAQPRALAGRRKPLGEEELGKGGEGVGAGTPGGEKGEPLPPRPQTGITGAPSLQSGGLGLDAAGHLPH